MKNLNGGGVKMKCRKSATEVQKALRKTGFNLGVL
jgi:hypothetical protein